jgi:CheY-like chemotaxis protein
VVKKLIEMHGGEVIARSEGLGHGSAFEIVLPRAEPPPPIFEEPSATRPVSCRVLIVDDNADAASSLEVLLRLDGHEVQAVFSSRAALEMAESFAPDFVLLDIGLPEFDGYEVARRLRLIPQFSRLTIVALTGYGQQEDRDRTRDAGFDAHLVKPVDLEDLERLLTQPR